MGWKRREGFYQRKRAALADVSDTALLDEIGNAVAELVAAEMSARPIALMLSPQQLEQRELERALAQWELEQRQQAREELNRQRREAEAARRAAQARADAQREARDRMEQYTRDRQARDQAEELHRLKQWATARETADWQRQQEGIAAANRQRMLTAHTNLMQAFDRSLRPDELPPQPAEPYQGSPHFGSPDFSPDAAIVRFQPWKPWQP